MKKIVALFLFFPFVCSSIFAQNPQKPETESLSWRVLQDAQLAYEQGAYGEAIKLADIAKQKRKNEVDWALFTLNQALKPASVQRVGDNIGAVRQILKERNSEMALEIIHQVLVKHSESSLGDSIAQLREKINLYSAYPEADYLLGCLYTLEGEYAIAEKFLLDAWEESYVLDIPDQKYDILYQMAYLAKLQKNYDRYEKNLLLIISADEYVDSNGKEGTLIKAVKRSIAKDDMTIDKLFLLYRSTAYTSLDAYYQLATFYDEKGENEKALTMSTLAALASFTRMYEAVKDRDMEYNYTTFLAYLKKVGEFYEIAEWGAKSGVWKGFFSFAKILYKNDRKNLAYDMLSTLSQYCPEDFWRNMALRELLINS